MKSKLSKLFTKTFLRGSVYFPKSPLCVVAQLQGSNNFHIQVEVYKLQLKPVNLIVRGSHEIADLTWKAFNGQVRAVSSLCFHLFGSKKIWGWFQV